MFNKINFLPFSGQQHFLAIKRLLSLTICCISGAILYPICGKCQTQRNSKYLGHLTVTYMAFLPPDQVNF